jgi:hypothetical protein
MTAPYGDMTAEEATDLFDLRCNWGDYYQITFVVDKRSWRAWRLGDATKIVRAKTTTAFRDALSKDHAAWQKEDGSNLL